MTASEGPLSRERFELAAADGFVIRGEAILPSDAGGTVILCHGFKGFFRWAFFPYLAERLTHIGLRVIAFNFSGSGVGPDLENFTELDAFERNTFTRELDDLAAVEREAERRGWLGESYGLFGHSRGGGMAILHAASSDRVGALVTWSAIAEVGRWPAEEVTLWRARGFTNVPNARTGQILRLGVGTLDEVERLKSSRLDIAGAARRVRAPWLIVHGMSDDTVPFGDAERLDAAADANRTELLLVEKANHVFNVKHGMDEPSPALAQAAGASVEFFRERLLGVSNP